MKLNDLLNAYRSELDATPAPNLDHLFEESKIAPPAIMRHSPAPWYALGGFAAAAALALIFWPKPQAITPVRATPPLVQEAVLTPAPEIAGPTIELPVQELSVQQLSAPRARHAINTALKPRIERTTFVALAEMDMLPEPRVYQVVRVSVDEARLVGLGLSEARPASGRKMAAQVLLGEDGIARAIRILGEERE